MPTAREVVRVVKRLRGEQADQRRRFLGDEYANVEGGCENVASVCDAVGGSVWRSNSALGHALQRYPGHSVAVIRTRGEAGVIVDYTDTSRTLIGSVFDVNDDAGVAEALVAATGYAGWWKKE